MVLHHSPQHASKLLLGDGHILDALDHALLLVLVQLTAPMPLHRGKDGNIQGLCEVGGVSWEKYEADVVLPALLHDGQAQVGSQIVSNQCVHLLLK